MGEPEADLRRGLSLPSVLAISIGTMIGAGIFVLPGIAIASAGPAAALSFLLAGVVALTTAASASELATGMPMSGGAYFFVHRAMGAAIGSIVGLGSWLGLILKGSFALLGLGEYVILLGLEPGREIIGVAMLLVLIALNVVGSGHTGRAQIAIVLVLLGLISLFVAIGGGSIRVENYRPFAPHGLGSVVATAGLVFVAYIGIDKIAAVSEEVKDPGRNIPRGLLISVCVVILLYVLVMLVVIGVVPSLHGFTTISDVAMSFMGARGALVITLAGVLATLSTGNAAILSSSRLPYAMARDGIMPARLTRVHGRFHTPHRAILATGGLMFGFIVVVDLKGLALMASLVEILNFTLMNISVVILRHVGPEWYNPEFRSPGYPFVQVIGIGGGVLFVLSMGWLALAGVGVLMVIGLAWYYVWDYADLIREESVTPELVRLIRAKSAAKHQIQPKEGVRRVIIPITEDDASPTLVAAALARNGRLLIPGVLDLPRQTPLGSWDRCSIEKIRPVKKALEEALRLARTQGIEVEDRWIVCREPTDTILELAGEWHADTVVLPLHEELSRNTRYLLNHLESDVVLSLLSSGDVQGVENVLVPTSYGKGGELAASVADDIATIVGAKITLLRVVSPASQEEAEAAREYHEKIADACTAPVEKTLIYSKNYVSAIVREAKAYDLVVLSTERRRRGSTFGMVPDMLVQDRDEPTIVVRPKNHVNPLLKILKSPLQED